MSAIEPFNLTSIATFLYITHEAYYTRLAHTFATYGQLLAILLLLNLINVLTIPFPYFSLISINFSLAMLIMLVLAIYFIYLEWFTGIITSLLLFTPLLVLKILEAHGYAFGMGYIVFAIALYFLSGIIQVLCHKWFDGERTSITLPKSISIKLLLIFYITFTNPFFFLLFLFIGMGYKRQTLGKAIGEKYHYFIKRDNYQKKAAKLDSYGKPIDLYNKPHPMDIV